ncbi:MAG TPA: DsrE/DsrF/DrsH-like family protein [Bacteroidales bacterium]|nr:DsrE/DsrF/DrsH-like family protein [Bacteroidales bacterium]
MAKKMTIGIGSGCVDKLTSVGVILSGAAADDMEVDVFILLNAGAAFVKNTKDDHNCNNQQTAEEFKKTLETINTPTWKEFFEMAKEMTKVKIYVCSLAGKVVGAEKIEDFIDIVDEICGIGEYITSLQESDVNLFI